jgi:hypothetical protein
MSAPFTPVTSTNLQNLALYHEVLLAHYERDAALGQAYTVPDLSTVWPPGLNVQQAALYRVEQSFLQGNEITGFGGTYNRFLDPAADIEGAAELPYLTLVRWRELANLHPDGFRRVTGNAWPADWTDLDDPAYSYGYCQAGDIIGPWLLTDIQRAYAPLTIVSYLPADSDAWIPDGHHPVPRMVWVGRHGCRSHVCRRRLPRDQRRRETWPLPDHHLRPPRHLLAQPMGLQSLGRLFPRRDALGSPRDQLIRSP